MADDAPDPLIPMVLIRKKSITAAARRKQLMGLCDDAERRMIGAIRSFDFDTRDESDMLDVDADRTEFVALMVAEVHRWYDRWRTLPIDELAPDFTSTPHVVRVARPQVPSSAKRRRIYYADPSTARYVLPARFA